MRESSKESRGVPLDSNLWMKPPPGSATKILPMESAANATGAVSFPGPSPLSPHAPRNSNGGGGACGKGDGSARFPHEIADVEANMKANRNARRPLEE